VKNLFKLAVLLLVVFVTFSNTVKAQTPDSLILPREYSLFSEYHKNKDYESALPYAWNILRIDPVKYNKWIYHKMEEALWYLHDSTQATDEGQKQIADTTLYMIEMAIKHYPPDAPYFQRKKGFVMQTWYGDQKAAITEYEKAIDMDSTADPYWYNQLGQLYKASMQENPDYKTKALDIFSYLTEREPNNPVWNTELEGLVENIDELIALAKKSWEFNKDDLSKGWKYASLCIKVNEYKEALVPLEYLVNKQPETINYNTQLALAYQKLEMFDKAVDQYNKLIKLDSKTKEHYLNLGLVYKERGQLSQARAQFQKASEVAGGWALALFYEGMLYEQSARSCSFDFETKVVYQLAVDTYRRAANMDPSLTQARDRVGALSGSTPTKEDYFFRKIKSGTTLPVTGSCFGWIGKSIVVP
jgi:tetratricopeptide (TPR) repeat protein